MKLPDIEAEHAFLVLMVCAVVAACLGHDWWGVAFFLMALLVAGS